MLNSWCQKPTHYRHNVVGVKEIAVQQSLISLWKENWILWQWVVRYFPLFIFSRSIWYHYPISSWSSKTLFLNECGGCREMGPLRLFCTLMYCLVPKKVPYKLISQIKLFCCWVPLWIAITGVRYHSFAVTLLHWHHVSWHAVCLIYTFS